MDAIAAFLDSNAPLRFAIFLAVFAVMAAWEVVAPRRELVASKSQRWTANLAILITNTVLVRAIFPAAAVGIAMFAEARGVGLLHSIDLHAGAKILLAVVALDLAIYLQHVMFHAVPLLWRLHRAHHADLDIDVTTGTRFHPVEMLMSMAIKAAAIMVIGAPALAVDGVIEINQAKVIAGGITGGDGAGFPALISAPGSYRLTSSLTTAANDVNVIEITSSNVRWCLMSRSGSIRTWYCFSYPPQVLTSAVPFTVRMFGLMTQS